jgi:hypothetical protein
MVPVGQCRVNDHFLISHLSFTVGSGGKTSFYRFPFTENKGQRYDNMVSSVSAKMAGSNADR